MIKHALKLLEKHTIKQKPSNKSLKLLERHPSEQEQKSKNVTTVGKTPQRVSSLLAV